jgi:hypothetical protein
MWKPDSFENVNFWERSKGAEPREVERGELKPRLQAVWDEHQWDESDFAVVSIQSLRVRIAEGAHHFDRVRERGKFLHRKKNTKHFHLTVAIDYHKRAQRYAKRAIRYLNDGDTVSSILCVLAGFRYVERSYCIVFFREHGRRENVRIRPVMEVTTRPSGCLADTLLTSQWKCPHLYRHNRLIKETPKIPESGDTREDSQHPSDAR